MDIHGKKYLRRNLFLFRYWGVFLTDGCEFLRIYILRENNYKIMYRRNLGQLRLGSDFFITIIFFFLLLIKIRSKLFSCIHIVFGCVLFFVYIESMQNMDDKRTGIYETPTQGTGM